LLILASTEKEGQMRNALVRLVLLGLLGATLTGCAVQSSRIQPDDSPSAAPGMFAPDILPNSRTRAPGT